MTYQNTNGETPRQRLADRMAPAILAVGKAASTETGKMLFAMACDYDASIDFASERMNQFNGKRPSKASQDAMYNLGMSWGNRSAFVSALASMACEMSGGKATMHLCRRIINAEIDMMRHRTEAQREAAPLSALCSKVIDW